MRWTAADQRRVSEWNRATYLEEQCRRAIAAGRVTSWREFYAVRATAAADEYRANYRRTWRAGLATRAYVGHDAEARWILDRETPGAFAAARAVNRAHELNKQVTCAGCTGRGFCQCD